MKSDLFAAARTLRRRPAVTTAVVATIGIALAANTTLFSIFDGLLFRPLPFPDADRLVYVEFPADVRRALPRPEVRRLDSLRATIPLLADRGLAEPVVIFDEGTAEIEDWKLSPARISPGLLRALAIRPAAGRVFTDEDADAQPPFSALRGTGGGWTLALSDGHAQAGPPAVMIGFELWRDRYGGDRSLVGQRLDLLGGIFRERPVLIGVMPRGFSFPGGANLWIPAKTTPSHFNVARLADGATVEQVEAMIPGLRVTPLREHLRPDGAQAIAVLALATTLLLAIAWVQVAALLFSQAAGRIREIGVRLALGASRSRLVRQFAVEGALLSLGALCAALVLTYPLTAAVVSILPAEMTRGQSLAPDVRTLAFAVGLSACGVLLFALLPVELIQRGSPAGLLGGRLFETVRLRASRVRMLLLIGQLGITTALLYLCGLAVHSFTAIAQVDLGFSSERLVGLQMPPTVVDFSGTTAQQRAAFDRQTRNARETLERIREVPGVVAAAFGLVPFEPEALKFSDGVPIIPDGSSDGSIPVRFNYIGADYPAVLNLRRVAGRFPRQDEERDGDPPALVNETLARRMARTGTVLGRRVLVGRRAWRVSGIVKDFLMDSPREPVPPQVLALTDRPQAQIVVRLERGARGDAALDGIAAAFAAIWPDTPSREVVSIPRLAGAALADYRSRAVVLTVIAVLCLPLAIAGVAGAIGYSVQSRTREMALRLAMGEEPRQIRSRIAAGAAASVAAGLAVGLGCGVLLGAVVESQLFGIGAVDPASLGATGLVLAAAGAVGTVVPALRAASIDPAQALKEL